MKDSFLNSKLGVSIPKILVYKDANGLSVSHSKTGILAFQHRGRLKGAQVRVGLGRYPDISLLDARNKNREARELLRAGIDPRTYVSEQEVEQDRGITFDILYQHWFFKYAQIHRKDTGAVKNLYLRHIKKFAGDLYAQDITHQDWSKHIVELKEAATENIAKKALGLIKQIYAWGYTSNLVSANPVDSLKAKDFKLRDKVRERVLQGWEVNLILSELKLSKISERTKIYLYLCLIYGNRSSELRISEVEHIDFDKFIWIVPAENHKTGAETKKPIVRPLIPETAAMFRRLIELTDSHLLFPSSEKLNQPTSRSSLNNVCYKLTSKLDRKGHHIDDFSIHDLRKTQRTNMSTLCDSHVAEKMLGHSLGRIRKVYDHEEYLFEMSEALTAWYKRIDGFKEGVYREEGKSWPPKDRSGFNCNFEGLDVI